VCDRVVVCERWGGLHSHTLCKSYHSLKITRVGVGVYVCVCVCVPVRMCMRCKVWRGWLGYLSRLVPFIL